MIVFTKADGNELMIPKESIISLEGSGEGMAWLSYQGVMREPTGAVILDLVAVEVRLQGKISALVNLGMLQNDDRRPEH